MSDTKQEGKQLPPIWITDFDKHLFNEGTHERAYEKLGAHLCSFGGKPGVHFAVWAPNAKQVSIIGDFNDWNGTSHPMEPSDSGIWNLFIENLSEYSVYKYHITAEDDQT